MLLTDSKVRLSSWAWLFILYPWGLTVEIESNSIIQANQNQLENNHFNKTSETSANDEALITIEQLLSLIHELQNDSIMHIENDTNIKINKTSIVISKFVRLMTELCHLLHPYKSSKQQGPIHLVYVPELTPYEPADHFGCKSLLTTLQRNITSMPQNSVHFVICVQNNVIQWKSKLLGSLKNNANSSSIVPILHKPSLTPPPYEYVTTTTAYRWNKGLTRYDNSWIRPGIQQNFNNKYSGREIIFYDSFDPTKTESHRISTLHSILRILPAFIVIAFLILCWYCFVYRRLQRRHRRTRTLLCQYQSLLNGHLGSELARNLMVVSNPDGSSNGVFCSSSTYNSCLNSEIESSIEVAVRSETTETPRNTPEDNRSRPRLYPPTYDEIFPPPYDSLYENVV